MQQEQGCKQLEFVEHAKDPCFGLLAQKASGIVHQTRAFAPLRVQP